MVGIDQWLYEAAARRRQSAIRLGIPFILSFFLSATLGCVVERQSGAGSNDGSKWQPWQVLETQTGRVLSSSQWIRDLESYDIVYLGEEHHNKYHIEAALKILEQLVSDGIQPTIGMEMFGWDGQRALDDYLSKGEFARSEFIERVRWKQNWGGAFEDYEPMVTLARDRQLPIRAMNPPRPLIRRVVKLGLEQASRESAWADWGIQMEDIVDEPAYRARIVEQLRRCHGGGTNEHYRTMYEASMVRDEGMAMTLVTRIEELRQDHDTLGPRGMIVSYTGAGHIQYNLPVPMRVARRLSGDVKQTTIYLTSFDTGRIEDVQDLMRDHIADYIWLTPVSGKGPPKRCR